MDNKDNELAKLAGNEGFVSMDRILELQAEAKSSPAGAARQGGENNIKAPDLDPTTSTATASGSAPSAEQEIESHVADGIREIADELENEVTPYEGDFADSVRGCIEALRGLADVSASAQASQAVASEVRESATDKAIQRAAAELPDGYEVIIELENGAGGVVWIDEHGARQIIEGEGHISDDINEAIDCALQHAAPALSTNPATPASKPEGGAA